MDSSIIDNWSSSSKTYVDMLLKEKRANDNVINQLDELYGLLNMASHEASAYQLVNMCEIFYRYCEITNTWNYWVNWAQMAIEKKIYSYEGLLYYGLGRSFEEYDNLEKSGIYHRQGIYYSKRDNNKQMLALNCFGLGIVLYRINSSRSKDFLKIACKLFKQNNEPYYLGCAYSDLGGYYYRKKNLQKKDHLFEGTHFLSKIIRILSKIIRRCKLITRNSVNSIQSIAFYFMAIITHKKKSYCWDMDRILYSLGCAFLDLKVIRCLSYYIFKSAEKIAIENNSNRYFALTQYGLGKYYYQRGEYNSALKYLQNARTVFEKYFLERGYYSENKFIIYNMLANTYIKLNNDEYATRYYKIMERDTLGEFYEQNKHITKMNQCFILLHLARKLELDESEKRIQTLVSEFVSIP